MLIGRRVSGRLDFIVSTLYLAGPDEWHAAPTKKDAVEVASTLNSEFADRDIKPHAVAGKWPYSPESHADGLPQWVHEWVTPNVEVTGAARPYRAASGGPQGYASRLLWRCNWDGLCLTCGGLIAALDLVPGRYRCWNRGRLITLLKRLVAFNRRLLFCHCLLLRLV